MITDPDKAMKAVVGQIIEGLTIDNGLVTITCSRGLIIFDFDESKIHIQVEDRQ